MTSTAGSGPSAVTYIAHGARVVGEGGSAYENVHLLASVVVGYASGEIRVWGLEGADQIYSLTVVIQEQALFIGSFDLTTHLHVLQC